MSDTVSIKFVGGVEDSINFKCPGVFKLNVQKGDIIENVPRETYEKELKNNFKFQLVSEKPQTKSGYKNKMEKETLPESEIN